MNTIMVHHHSARLLATVVLSGFFTIAQASPKLPPTEREAMIGHSSPEKTPVRMPADRSERLSYKLKDGVKEFHLTAEPVLWEYAGGRTIMAWGYNGQVPGPEIRVTEGDLVRIVFENRLPVATTIHWHGLHVPSDMDGIPGVTQRPIAPGESFTYEFTVKPAGTRFYHTHGAGHGDEATQLDMGLSGAFIIDPRDHKHSYDREFTLILDEWELQANGVNGAIAPSGHTGHGEAMEHAMNYNLFTINGRVFPNTQPLTVKEGERVRIRLINASSSTIHPIHIHGHSFKVVTVDGNPVPEALQLTRDTITLTPGERYDIEFVADNPGTWLLHCHELHHADMGMVAPLHYEGYPVMKKGWVNSKPQDKPKPQAEEAPQKRGHHGRH